MDCSNLAEQVTAFYEVFAEDVSLPASASVVGTTIKVVGIDIADHGEEPTATCHNGDAVQTLWLSHLVFAPDIAAGWIHAAYRHCLGLAPNPAAVPEGWAPSWL